MDSENARFKQVRQKLGLTLKDLVLMTGYSASTISGVENGHDRPSRRLRQMLIDRLGVGEHWLATGRGAMFKDSKEVAHAKIITDYSFSPAEEDITNDPEFVGVINKLRMMPPADRKRYLAALHRLLDELVKKDNKSRLKNHSTESSRDKVDASFASLLLAVAQDVLSRKPKH